ncbi:NUDIX hydrolase [Paenibacillus tengchongensis]|uniref:NUDIX hydrolase n=1 Tax=Paenibacillus tengchongensis TaxID=2608684 RepID=UPI00124E763A|nr:NUDIX domain-containing protein [Paenibacillus tengchongensis]
MAKNSRSIIVAVKGVILNQGRVLLVQRTQADAVGAGTWECAGGKIEFGEGLEDALAREIKEETGLTVAVGDLLYATSFLTDQARQLVLLTYLCRSGGDKVQLSEEHSQYLWCTRNELQELLPAGILEDFTRSGVWELPELV